MYFTGDEIINKCVLIVNYSDGKIKNLSPMKQMLNTYSLTTLY
ncbi:hypothetical protein P278_31110 [Zhouia amylolytica AD3]|uniref:Uncharacterized protein n=1 Tax=Zhouia amylolytica AD3 TaxID=1286632 RepID=W2UJ55_9FLAO|nr:hypothetical protein P278_31110 [Zhouia amylolytica AD3]